MDANVQLSPLGTFFFFYSFFLIIIFLIHFVAVSPLCFKFLRLDKTEHTAPPGGENICFVSIVTGCSQLFFFLQCPLLLTVLLLTLSKPACAVKLAATQNARRHFFFTATAATHTFFSFVIIFLGFITNRPKELCAGKSGRRSAASCEAC